MQVTNSDAFLLHGLGKFADSGIRKGGHCPQILKHELGSKLWHTTELFHDLSMDFHTENIQVQRHAVEG